MPSTGQRKLRGRMLLLRLRGARTTVVRRYSPRWLRLASGCAAAYLLWCGAARAQISPGALSRAHAQFEGVMKCATCHDLTGRGFKCLECHDEIKSRVERGTGFHGRAYKPSATEADCVRCHAEHRGPSAALILLDRSSFDHGAQTGFALEGKHRQQKCESCHTPGNMPVASRSEIKLKDLNHSFLGLSSACTGCHQEPHQGQLGTECLRCHNFDAWKPAPGFSHSSTAFPLTGQHLHVACAKCHAKRAGMRASAMADADTSSDGNASQMTLRYKGLSFSGCQNCHTDPHQGAFQEVKQNGRCDGCHNPAGWKSNRPGKDFNHNLTKFKLVGKHTELDCEKCHHNGAFRKPIAHELCQNCHEDPHQRQFAGRAAGSDCSACHNTSSFKPPLFDRAAHGRSAFPLIGKHASLPCAKCHQPEGPKARFKTGKLTCPACHAEPHGGEFADEPYSNRCNLCHTQDGFETTTFTLDRHSQTRFPLLGRHAELDCNNCHKPLTTLASAIDAEVLVASSSAADMVRAAADVARNARRQYHFASRECMICHADPHRLEAQADWSCESCHTPQSWKTLLPFDHAQTGFELTGAHLDAAHQPIACVQCHKPSNQATGSNGSMPPSFSKMPSECAACHREKDAHGGQFSSPAERARDCSSCHVPAGWDGAAFQHDSARFALDVAHRNVECVKCHKEQRNVNGKMVRVYRGTPIECLSCH